MSAYLSMVLTFYIYIYSTEIYTAKDVTNNSYIIAEQPV
jgi:hypothetical protein